MWAALFLCLLLQSTQLLNHKNYIMKNYRITNLKTNVQHFMNEEEKDQFLKINNRWYYFAEDMQPIKALAKRKKIENIIFMVFSVCLFAASYLALCEILTIL